MLAGLGTAVFLFGTPEVWSWARSAPAQAATQAPAGRTLILPGIRKEGDRRP